MDIVRGLFSNRIPAADIPAGQSLEFWRERIYDSMIATLLFWGLLALIPSVYLSFASGLSGLGIFDLLAYSLLVILYLLRNSFSYTLRALIFVLLGYSLGVVVFFATGGEGAGLLWLFAVPPFASLLLGLPWGLFISALNVFFLVGVGVLINNGSAAIPGFQDLTLSGWVVYGVNFLAANAIVTVPLGVLLKGLFTAAEKQQTLQHDYQLLFDNNPLPMWVYEYGTLRFLAVNKAAIDHYGYSRQEFQTMTIKDIRPKEEVPALEKNIASFAHKASQTSGPWKHRKKDGSLIDVEIHSQNIDFFDKEARLVLAKDVTELIKTGSEIREREELYRILAENSQTFICTHDFTGKILTVNDVAVQLTGYSRERILSMNMQEFITPEWRKLFPRYLSRVRKQGKAHGIMQIKTISGSIRTWEYNNLLWIDKYGEPIVRGMAHDITEQLEAQSKLRQADQILQHVKSLVMVSDRDGSITYVSPSSKELIGYEPEELLGDGWWKLMYQDSIVANGERAVDKRIARGEIPSRVEPYVRPVRTKLGKICWIEWQDSMGPNETLIDVGRDVTEQKRAEQALRQRLGELEAIREISTSLRSASTVEEMLPILIDTTIRVCKVDSGAIWLYDSLKDEIRVAISRGYLNANGNEIVEEIPPEKPGTGLAGQVFLHGYTHVGNDYRNDKSIPEEVRQKIPRGIGGITLPIRTERGPIGVLAVNTRLPRTPNGVEVNLLTTIAEMAGNAIQRTTLHEKTQKQLGLFQALSEIDRAILSNLDLSHNLKLLLQNVTGQLGVDAANIMLFDPVLQTLQSVEGSGFLTESFERKVIDIGEGYAGKAASERKIVRVDDLDNNVDNPRLARALIGEGFISYFGVPLVAKGALRGVLEIFNRTPLNPDAEWFDLLNSLAGRAAIAIDTIKVFENLERTNQDLILSYDATIEGWSRALDLRDKETEGHSQRVTNLGLELARRMGLSGQQLVNFRRGALLHDIGKMAVPDTILFKPSKLTDEEWIVMKKHTTYAQEMLMDISYLRDALEIPYSHHERWDGSGYPLGLKEEQIPISARIFAVADVYDALTSDRPYRAAWTKEKTVAYIREESGKLFDPNVVDVFLKTHLSTQALKLEKDALL